MMSILDDYVPEEELSNEDLLDSYNPTKGNAYTTTDRGFLGDTLHNLWKGVGNAAELGGAMVEQYTGGAMGSTLRGIGEAVEDTTFAKPDVPEYYGQEGKLKKGYSSFLQSAPSMVPIVGAGLLGGVPAAGTMTMAMYGGGTYKQARERIELERPDLPEEEKDDYAWNYAMYETIPETVSNMATLGAGKILFGAKPLFKAGAKALLGEGGVSFDTLTKMAMKGMSKTQIAATMGLGVGAESLSEVYTAVKQYETDEAYGIAGEAPDLWTVAIAGALGTPIIGGVGAIKGMAAVNKVKSNIKKGLESENLEQREFIVNSFADQMATVDPEYAETFRSELLAQVQVGPVDMAKVFSLEQKKAIEEQKIIEDPKEILRNAGIPLGAAELADRTDLDATPEVFEETRVLDEGAYYESPEFTDAIEESVKGYMDVSRDEKPLAGTSEYDEFIQENDKLTTALRLDDARSKGIKAGMAKVLSDTNKLAEITDLDEREVLRKSIEKTKNQIAAEVKAVPVTKARKGKAVATAVVAPVEQKTPKGTVAPTGLPKVTEEDVTRAQAEAGIVPTTAKVKTEATPVPPVTVKTVEVAPEPPTAVPVTKAPAVSTETRKIPEGKTYKEQLLITEKIEEDRDRAQAVAKTGKPEQAAAAKQEARLLANDAQRARLRLQSMSKPKAKEIPFKSKKDEAEAQRLGAPIKMGESEATVAIGLQDKGIDITPAVRLILSRQKKLSKQDLKDPKKVKEAVESAAKSLETPQQIKATGIGKGRTIEFHDSTELISMGENLELHKRWMVKQGTLTKRVPSEKAGKAAIAEGTVKDLPDYDDPGRQDVMTRELPKLTQAQKAEVDKVLEDKKFQAFGNIGDVSLAASLMSIKGNLYVDGKLNVKGLASKIESIKDTLGKKNSEAQLARAAGITSGVTREVELTSTETDVLIPKEKKTRTKEEVAAENKAKKEALDAEVVTVEATEDLKAQILARMKAAMAKQAKAGTTLEDAIGKEGAKRVRAKKEIEDILAEEEGDHALYNVDDRLSWKKNREPKLTDEFINQVTDNYLAPANFNPLEAIFNFTKQYPNPRTQDLIDTQMLLVSHVMAEKTVMKNYFSNNYKNALQLLDGVIANGGPEASALAKFIKESPKIKELESMPVTVTDGVSFFTSRNGGAISIRANGMMDVNVWLHELQHAVTSREILSNKELRDEVGVMMRNLRANSGLTANQLKAVDAAKGSSQKFNEVAKQYSAFTDAQYNIAYSLVNEREFLSQAYSSSAVRDVMRSTRHSAGSFKDSIWKRIKKFFSDIMRLPKGYDSVLEAALRVSEKLYKVDYHTGLEITEMAPDPKRREETLDEATRTVLAERKAENLVKTKLTEKSAQALMAFKKLAQPISDTLKGLSDPIYARLMQMEATQNLKSKEYKDGVEPFLRYYKGLTDSQKVRLDIGLLNRNEEVWNEMPKDVRASLERVLDDGAERSIAVGYLTEKKPLYFPRRVKDIEGLVKHLTENMEENGPIALALKAKADSVGMEVNELPQSMRNQVISDMLASGEIMQLPKPGSAKKRTIGKVTSDLVPFYENSSDAVLAHIYELNDKVSLKEFVGSSSRKRKIKELMALNTKIDKETDEVKKTALMQKWEEDARALNNLEEELSGGIQELIDKELSKAPSAVQKEVFELLSARLRQKGASGIFDTMRNVGYIATMGNFLSAITQLGDIPIIFYRYGVTMDNIKAIGSAFKAVGAIAKGEITGKDAIVDAFVQDLDFTGALREFSGGNRISSKALETVFKYSGLKYMDLIGKETAMNASFRFYQNPKNKQKFMDKFENFFEKPEEVLQKIQMGNRRDKDVLTAIFAELSDFQPISLSQQSEVYLKGGNARMFFALKTFTLRTTSAAITEGMMEMRKGGAMNTANGVKKIAAILLLYAAAGAGADELKDLLKGRESSASDNVIDNLLQMLFLSKFTLEKGMQKDQVIQGIIEGIIPPVRYMDNFIADISGILMEDKELKYKSTSLIPLVGTVIQARTTAQQTSYADQARKKILADVKANAKSRRGAYYGSITDKVREYNKSVPSDKKLKSSDIMGAYKRE